MVIFFMMVIVVVMIADAMVLRLMSIAMRITSIDAAYENDQQAHGSLRTIKNKIDCKRY